MSSAVRVFCAMIVLLVLLAGVGTTRAEELNLSFADSYYTAGHAYDIAVSGNYAYVADDENGFVVVHTGSTTNPYDTNKNNVIENGELFVAIGDWKIGRLENADLLDIIGYWKSGKPYC